MKKEYFDLKNKSAIEQRNIALVFATILAISVILSLVALVNQEKTTIIIPSKISNEYSISTKGYSNITYLEDMGISTAYNFLNISKENFEFAKNQILKITAPERISFVKKLFFKTERIVSHRRLNTTFRVQYLKANALTNSVKIYGNLISFIGGKQSSAVKKAYKISFKYQGATLLLHSFEEIKYVKNGGKIK